MNPALGAPPTIEWIAVDRLQVDETYQRSCANPASAGLIGRIAMGWDWRLFQPLACAKRADGAIVVIDGQHRLLGARSRGDIPHLPCVVGQFETVAEEATAFAAMNRQRKSMNNLELYRAQIAGGDPAAIEALGVIHAAGLRLARTTNPNSWKVGDIVCIGGVVRCIRQYGDVVARRALDVLTQAYPGKVLTYAGTLLDPVARVVRNEPPADVVRALSKHSQAWWRGVGDQAGTLTRVSMSAAIETAICAAMDIPYPSARRPDAPDRQPGQPAKPLNGASVPLPAPPGPKRRKTFEEELEASRNGTAIFVERVVMPSRPATELIGGSSLA